MPCSSLLVSSNDYDLLVRCVFRISGAMLPGKRCDRAESLVLFQHGRGLPPPFAHVVFDGVELGHIPSIRLSWGALNHVAAILWSPQGWMAAIYGSGGVSLISQSKQSNQLWDHCFSLLHTCIMALTSVDKHTA